MSTDAQTNGVADFLAKSKTSVLYNTPGRGHIVLKTVPMANPPCPVRVCTSKLRPQLTLIGQAHADALRHVGASHEHQSRGTGIWGRCSVKVQTAGQRRVLCISAHGLFQFCKHGVAASATVPMAHLCQLLKAGDAAMASASTTARVEMYAHDHGEGEVLYVPLGFIVCERVLNGHDVGGFRWTLLSQHVTATSMDPAKLLLFSDPSKIPAGSTMALLVKVTQGLKKMCLIAAQQCIDDRFPPEYFAQPVVKTDTLASPPTAAPSKRFGGGGWYAKSVKA